ncbi:helix-turn-helix domain-containing protein [Nocardioides carbamazepini]|uniref:PucR family transcriptional regulator n=1 Tax=Nocardioides carbamazepini TaxID=2854259 RepID=UPI0021499C9B|nr:helix-turn-helix domain-containing protein [Nocardioides carbamazepini]MCR1781954.1 helix-turn-helix domain-containing protein [Nocardioides carbamazepini]
MSVEMETGLATWLAGFLGAEAQPEMVRKWVDRTYTAITTEIPQLARDERLAAALHSAVEQHWLAFLHNFAQPEFEFRLVESGRTLAVEIAAAGLPVEVVIKIYRVAQQDVWAYGTEVIQQISPEVCSQSDALIYFWDRAGAWIQAAIDVSTSIYHATRSKQSATPEIRLLGAVREVLTGDASDPRRISAHLGGYPVTLKQTALVLEGAHADHVTLERLAGQAAEAVGAGRQLVVHPGQGRAWAWMVGTFDARRLNELNGLLGSTDMSISVGVTAEGLDGFIMSHEDAVTTHEIVCRAPRDPRQSRVTFYEDVELSALLACSPRVDRFVTRVLGQLAENDGTMEKLRETIAAFLDHGRNVDEAASTLSVHRNTVRYRLGQAEGVLASPIAKLGADLEVALRHYQLFHSGD